MKCPQPKCEGNLTVTNTYMIGVNRTQRASCPECKTVVTLHTEVTAINPIRGEGAAALAQRIRKTASS